MVARARVLALIVAAVALLGVAPAAMAAGPTHAVDTFNDPQADIDESVWASDLCGFAIDADVAGHRSATEFSGTGRSVLALYHYAIRVTYTNVETGTTIRLRDIGPDRFFTKDGRDYVAVTGRSTTGAGNIGVVIFDLETGEVVHQAGNDTGFFYDTFCDAMA